MFDYKARFLKAIDGDTIKVDIDLGFDVWLMGAVIRLARIDAPEIRSSQRIDAEAAKGYLEKLLMGRPIKVITDRDKEGKYGRVIAEVYYQESNGISVNVSDKMAVEGFAKLKKYS